MMNDEKKRVFTAVDISAIAVAIYGVFNPLNIQNIVDIAKENNRTDNTDKSDDYYDGIADGVQMACDVAAQLIDRIAKSMVPEMGTLIDNNFEYLSAYAENIMNGKTEQNRNGRKQLKLRS